MPLAAPNYLSEAETVHLHYHVISAGGIVPSVYSRSPVICPRDGVGGTRAAHKVISGFLILPICLFIYLFILSRKDATRPRPNVPHVAAAGISKLITHNRVFVITSSTLLQRASTAFKVAVPLQWQELDILVVVYWLTVLALLNGRI